MMAVIISAISCVTPASFLGAMLSVRCIYALVYGIHQICIALRVYVRQVKEKIQKLAVHLSGRKIS